jgi:hypothetical protein
MSNLSNYTNGVPKKTGTGDKTPHKSNTTKKTDLGKGKVGEKVAEGSEGQSPIQISSVVYGDDAESVGKVYVKTRTGHDDGLYDKQGVGDLQSEMGVRVVKEISYGIATKNPYTMGVILAARGALTFADARNQDKSVGSALAYTVVGNYLKPTTITYAPFQKIMHKIEHSGKVGEYFVASAEWVHHAAEKLDIGGKIPVGTNPANALKFTMFQLNPLARAEKEATLATLYYAPKKLLFGDDSHNNTHDAQINKHTGDLGHGAANHVEAAPSAHGATGLTTNTPSGRQGISYVSEGPLQDSTLPPVELVTPAYTNPHSDKAKTGNFWEDQLVKAGSLGGGQKKEGGGWSWSSPVSSTVAWLIGGIDDIVRDIGTINQAADALAAGKDENDAKRQRVAAVLNDLVEAGGSYTIKNGNLEIVPPPPKEKESLTTGKITVINQTDATGTTLKSNAIAAIKLGNTKKIKATLDGAAAKKKVDDNMKILEQARQQSAGQRAAEASIMNSKAAEGAIYGQGGAQGKGIGVRQGTFGQVNIYTQQLQQVRGVAPAGTPTISPRRGY